METIPTSALPFQSGLVLIDGKLVFQCFPASKVVWIRDTQSVLKLFIEFSKTERGKLMYGRASGFKSFI